MRSVRQGQLIPRGYGLAWLQWDCDAAIFLPIPINVVARLGRTVWLWFVHTWGIEVELLRARVAQLENANERLAEELHSERHKIARYELERICR